MPSALDWVSKAVECLCRTTKGRCTVEWRSATDLAGLPSVDAVITDPPYYGAIPYADLADCFYVWLRRVVGDQYPEVFENAEVIPRSKESYSRYREVRRLDGSPFRVTDFLREVRRLVTDFALGRILHGASTEGLDETTRYYLMHRSSFVLDAAPAGECILLAQGYSLDLNDLCGGKGVLTKAKGSDLRLTGWDERHRDDLGLPDPAGGLPFIDALHRAMRLWTAGDAGKLREYLDQHGLQQSELFWTVAQAVLEVSEPKARERTLLEAIIAWGRGKQARDSVPAQTSLFTGETTL